MSVQDDCERINFYRMCRIERDDINDNADGGGPHGPEQCSEMKYFVKNCSSSRDVSRCFVSELWHQRLVFLVQRPKEQLLLCHKARRFTPAHASLPFHQVRSFIFTWPYWKYSVASGFEIKLFLDPRGGVFEPIVCSARMVFLLFIVRLRKAVHHKA